MADPRLTVTPDPGRKRDALADVRCASCGTRLVVGLRADTDRAERLAIANATARPCCSAWAKTEGGKARGEKEGGSAPGSGPFFEGGV